MTTKYHRHWYRRCALHSRVRKSQGVCKPLFLMSNLRCNNLRGKLRGCNWAPLQRAGAWLAGAVAGTSVRRATKARTEPRFQPASNNYEFLFSFIFKLFNKIAQWDWRLAPTLSLIFFRSCFAPPVPKFLFRSGLIEDGEWEGLFLNLITGGLHFLFWHLILTLTRYFCPFLTLLLFIKEISEICPPLTLFSLICQPCVAISLRYFSFQISSIFVNSAFLRTFSSPSQKVSFIREDDISCYVISEWDW